MDALANLRAEIRTLGAGSRKGQRGIRDVRGAYLEVALGLGKDGSSKGVGNRGPDVAPDHGDGLDPIEHRCRGASRPLLRGDRRVMGADTLEGRAVDSTALGAKAKPGRRLALAQSALGSICGCRPTNRRWRISGRPWSTRSTVAVGASSRSLLTTASAGPRGVTSRLRPAVESGDYAQDRYRGGVVGRPAWALAAALGWFLAELNAVGCDLYLEKQALDTTTPAGRALFQMLGVFAEFERATLQERIHAGIARARKNGTKSGAPIGRARVSSKIEDAIRVSLASGKGIHKTARECGVGTGTVQRIKREMTQSV
jgi:hypothetical protein